MGGEWREPFAEAQGPYDELMGFAKFAATLALRLRLRWSKSNQKRPAAVPYRSLRVALGPANLMRGAMPCQARDFDSDSAGHYRDSAAARGRNTRLLRLMQPRAQAGTYLMDRLMSSDTRARNAYSESESFKLYTPP